MAFTLKHFSKGEGKRAGEQWGGGGGRGSCIKCGRRDNCWIWVISIYGFIFSPNCNFLILKNLRITHKKVKELNEEEKSTWLRRQEIPHKSRLRSQADSVQQVWRKKKLKQKSVYTRVTTDKGSCYAIWENLLKHVQQI